MLGLLYIVFHTPTLIHVTHVDVNLVYLYFFHWHPSTLVNVIAKTYSFLQTFIGVIFFCPLKIHHHFLFKYQKAKDGQNRASDNGDDQLWRRSYRCVRPREVAA